MADNLRVAVLISGRGTNLQALIDACAKNDFPAEIVRVISNNEDAFGLKIAQAAGLSTTVINHRGFKNRTSFEETLSADLEEHGTELICLAGFMRLLTSGFVRYWHDRLINIHPSLLPKFKGLNTFERVLKKRERKSGCTVHFVNEKLDAGKIILRKFFYLDKKDNVASIKKKTQNLEYNAFSEAIIRVVK